MLIENSSMQQALPQLRQTHFVLLAPVPEWLEDDGVRSVDEDFASVGAFRDMLNELGIRFIEFDGSCKALDERVQRTAAFASVE